MKRFASYLHPRTHGWAWYLALGGLLTAAYVVFPPLKGNGPLINLLGLSSSVAIAVGIYLHRPKARAAWLLFILGQFLFFAGDLYTYSYPKVFGAEVEFPEAGNWMVAAAIEVDGGRSVGRGAVPVSAEVPAAVGSKAKPVATPVATTAAGRKKICTRDPACPLHAISLDDALAAGRPTVVTFATPLLCSSQMCGPVVDEQMVAADKLGAKASFIHVEIYPSRSTAKPVRSFLQYGFTTEPWLLVIDRDGVIRARYEGPVTADQVSDALRPLLA